MAHLSKPQTLSTFKPLIEAETNRRLGYIFAQLRSVKSLSKIGDYPLAAFITRVIKEKRKVNKEEIGEMLKRSTDKNLKDDQEKIISCLLQ